MTEAQQEQKKDGGLLQTKFGPFPLWLYLVIVGLGVFLVIYLKRQSSSQNTTGTDTQSSATIPPFINQVYTGGSPPDSSSPSPRPTKLEKTTGAHTLVELAKNWGLTEEQFIRLNPKLAAKYDNTGKKIPKGTTIKVYPKTANANG